MSSVFSKQMVSGVGNVMDIIRGRAPVDKAIMTGTRIVAGFTNPAFVRFVESVATGGEYPDTKTDKGALMAMVPFGTAASGTGAINVLGETIKASGTTAMLFRRIYATSDGGPLQMTPEHPILTPLAEAGLAFSQPSRREVMLFPRIKARTRVATDEEYHRFVRLRGEAIKRQIPPQVAERLSDQVKRTGDKTYAEKMISHAGSAATRQALMELERDALRADKN